MDKDRNVLLTVALEARSEPVGVQDSRLVAFSMERRRTRHKPVGAVRHWQRTPHARSPQAILFVQKQPADVDDGEGIVRPIASLTRSPCT